VKRIANWLPEITLVLAVAVLFHRLLLGEVLFWGTPSLQFYPWREMASSALRRGRLPLWNPLVGNGAPLLANYQTAVFYPPNWLNLILPTEHLMGWLGMLHLVWAGLGMIAYLRRLGIDRLGQGVGALAYALSGYLVSRFGFLSITSAAPWLPWLLWALDGLWDAEGRTLRRRVAMLGGLVGMQLLAGHAQTTFYSLLLAGLYALWRAVQQRDLKRLLPALGGAGLGFGLAAIQLLPTLELMLTSQRSGGVDEILALTYSYWPWRPMTWIAPNIFGNPASGDYWGYGAYWEDATYVGLLSIVLAAKAALGWVLAPREDTPGREVVPFFFAIIPPVVVLALGKNTPVFVWLFHHVPTFDLFQAPARWMLLAVFAMAVLAGVGAHNWQTTERGLFWTRLATAGGGSALVVALVAQQQLGGIEPTFARAMVRLGIVTVILGALTLLQPEPGARFRRLWASVALVILTVDLVTASWGLNPTIDPAFYRMRSSLANDLAPDLDDSRTLYLPQDEYAAKFTTFLDTKDFGPASLEAWAPLRQSLLPNLGMLDGLPSANNFDPLRVGPHDVLFESTRDARLDEALPILRAMNIGALLTTETSSPGDLESIAHAGPVTAYAVPEPLPRAYVVSEAWEVESVEEALSAMGRDDFDPARVVILEVGAPDRSPLQDGETDDSTANILREDSTTITIDVQTHTGGWLVLIDSWYPGWQANLDADHIPILRANGAFRAVAVPRGHHTVTFTYRPHSLPWGAAISGLSIAAVIALTQPPVPSSWIKHLKKIRRATATPP
jgi:hypothetical protein